MGARDLLADAAGAGLTIAADGDRLVIRPASMLTVGSSVRCRTSVGTRIDGRILSMLISLFMRIKLMTAEGLPPSLSKRPHQR